jgi:nucleoid-associated protein YgaU
MKTPAISGACALLMCTLAVAGVSAAIPAAKAAQAVATFRVGIRILPVSARIAPAPPPVPPSAQASSAPAAEGQDTATAPQTQPGLRTLIVRPGETLSAIAARIYGDASRYAEIYDANRDRLPSPDRLPAGIRLRLP